MDVKERNLSDLGAYIIIIAFSLFIYADYNVYNYPPIIILLRIGIIFLFLVYILLSKSPNTKIRAHARKLYFLAMIIVILFVDVLVYLNAHGDIGFQDRSIQVAMVIMLGIVLFAENYRTHIPKIILLNTFLILGINIVVYKELIGVLFTYFNYIFFSFGIYAFNKQLMRSKAIEIQLKKSLLNKVEELEAEAALQEIIESELSWTASHDSMTSLYNRGAGLRLLDKYFQDAVVGDTHLSVCYMDLNNLKWINDHIGHEAGDKYIVDFAGILASSVRNDDLSVRVGGDEFIIILKNVDYSNAMVIKDKIQKKIDAFNIKENLRFPLSVSYGISERKLDKIKSMNDLVACADSKMFEHKKEQKCNLRQFS